MALGVRKEVAKEQQRTSAVPGNRPCPWVAAVQWDLLTGTASSADGSGKNALLMCEK